MRLKNNQSTGLFGKVHKLFMFRADLLNTLTAEKGQDQRINQRVREIPNQFDGSQKSSEYSLTGKSPVQIRPALFANRGGCQDIPARNDGGHVIAARPSAESHEPV